MFLLILLVIGAALVVGGIVVALISMSRSRSARSDWLGELDDIRRSALIYDDDEEGHGLAEDDEPGGVDGPTTEASDAAAEPDAPAEPVLAAEPDAPAVPVLAAEPDAPAVPVLAAEPDAPAVPVLAEEPVLAEGLDATDRADAEEPPEGAEPDAAEAPSAAGEPVDDPAPAAPVPPPPAPGRQDGPPLRAVEPDGVREVGGRRFEDYRHGDRALTRLELGDAVAGRRETAFGGTIFTVELREGSVWHRPAPGSSDPVTLIVHTPAGWVSAHGGNVLVTSEPDGWCYTMCLEGTCTVETASQGTTARLEAGQVGRCRRDLPEMQVAEADPALALEDELVKMHLGLDEDVWA